MVDFRKDRDRTILNMNVVVKELDSCEPYEDPDNEGQWLQTMYLGSILNLTPSGKVYYPFACSNVMGCPCCKGTGEIKNKHRRKKTIARLNKTFRLMWPTTHNIEKLQKMRKQIDWWKPILECPECAGTGSLEARLDQDWQEQLERELETIGAWHHESEDDGCDVMISREAKSSVDKQLEKERDICENCDERSCIGCARCE